MEIDKEKIETVIAGSYNKNDTDFKPILNTFVHAETKFIIGFTVSLEPAN